ncbi:DUF4265 domain-containing protein [Streptomyces purpureus]|uniref:DUF4265 domain-containing protein n=1 Tax=Streptomyces purpureus TaxID=1951 RepID=UPI001FD52BB2|nr:DUF4265 domain-containing protein [Streptomyces purpureus]
MTSISDDHVKVHFRLEVDEDGWPPASVESLWAVDLGDGTVRLDNTPWFVRGVASDDVIRVAVDDEGVHWAGETVRASENCTIRLIVMKDGGSGAARQTVLETFHRLGTTGEGIEQFRMVALDVPPDADLRRIRKLLEHGEAKGWWHWRKGVSPPRGRPRPRSDCHERSHLSSGGGDEGMRYVRLLLRQLPAALDGGGGSGRAAEGAGAADGA